MAILRVGARNRAQATAAREREPGSLVVQIRRAAGPPLPSPPALQATIDISVRDRALGRVLEQHIAASVRSAFAERARLPPLHSVTVRTRADLRAKGEQLAGAVVVVPLDTARIRALPALLQAIEQQSAAGIQLVVGHRGALPAQVAEPLFALLEARRGSGQPCPLLLSRTDALAEIWYFLPAATSGTTAGSHLPAPRARRQAAGSPAHRVRRKP